jgi:hypothetical protein
MPSKADLSHFVDLVVGGNLPGSSRGEGAAGNLAIAAYRHYLTLDASARRGFVQWLEDLERSPSGVCDWLEGLAYDF